MPITPFHFGPGAALHALAPRHVSFIAFCSANVVIDLESLHNLVMHRHPVHAFFHTYLGASLAILATIGLFVAAQRVALRWDLPNVFGWRDVGLLPLVGGAAAGGYSHVVLDSVMHGDITPLAPFSQANMLLGWVSLDALHWICLGAAAFGLIGVLLRRLVRA